MFCATLLRWPIVVQVHVLPRRFGDFEPNDKVYDAIDEAAKEQNRHAQQRDRCLSCCVERNPAIFELPVPSCTRELARPPRGLILVVAARAGILKC